MAEDERSRIELARESELLRAVFQSIHEVVFAVDLEGRLAYANERALEMTGRPRSELLGLHFTEILVPDDHAAAMESWERRLRERAPFLSERQIQHRDGSVWWAQISMSPMVVDGELVGLAGVAVDMSERRRAEELLRQSEARYRELADMLPQTVFEMDGMGFLTFVNRAAFETFRYDQSDFEEGISVTSLIVPEDRIRAAQAIARRVAGEELGFNEYTAVRKDGTTFPVLVLASPIVRDGATQGVRGILVDMTPQKEVERQLAERNAELEIQSRSKDEFLSTVSHELRTPLVTGIGYVELLLEGRFGSISAKAASAMRVALKNLERLRGLVEEILSYDDLAHRDLVGSPAPEPFDLRALLEESAAELRARTGRARASIEVRCPEDALLVRADQELIHTVLANLLDNADRHGGREASVWLSAAPSGPERVVVSVGDDGHGMTEEVRLRAFEPFFKHDAEGEGAGLGLALVKRILTAHGTVATIESSPGRGAKVSFELERARADGR